MCGVELYNYCSWLRQSLLHQPWKQRKYPPQFEDGYTSGWNPNIMTHSRPKHIACNKSSHIQDYDTGGRPHSSWAISMADVKRGVEKTWYWRHQPSDLWSARMLQSISRDTEYITCDDVPPRWHISGMVSYCYVNERNNIWCNDTVSVWHVSVTWLTKWQAWLSPLNFTSQGPVSWAVKNAPKFKMIVGVNYAFFYDANVGV